MAGKHLLLQEKAKKKKNVSNHEKNVTKKTTKRKPEDDYSTNKKKIVNGNDDNDERDTLTVPDSASDCVNEVQANGEEDEEIESIKIASLLSRKGKEKREAKKESKPEDEGNLKKSKPNDEGKVKKNGHVKEATHIYSFPMDRISRMIKVDDPDIRTTQEAVFLINKASEKFLELFTKEGYTNIVLDKKKQVDYRHLSSVVTKKRRFDFLSDFVPEKVRAEDALAEASTANP